MLRHNCEPEIWELYKSPSSIRIRCFETEIIKIIDEFTFKFKDDVDINEDFIFIYGTFKEDFKTLDYKSLHAFNIQATKDLYKLVQDLQNRITILENK